MASTETAPGQKELILDFHSGHHNVYPQRPKYPRKDLFDSIFGESNRITFEVDVTDQSATIVITGATRDNIERPREEHKGSVGYTGKGESYTIKIEAIISGCVEIVFRPAVNS